MITTIERRVCIEPQFLDSNIMQHLFDKLKRSVQNECTKEYGYIIKVESIIEISDNWISSANSDIVFNVVFEAETLKPEIGLQLQGNVCMIFPNGILLDIQNKLKFLVPLESLKGYELNSVGMCYEKGGTKINKGDELTVEVVEIKYKDRSFMCFGNLVD